MSLTRTIDADIEPVLTTEAKKQVELPLTVTDHDDHLRQLIKTARRMTEDYCRRAWHQQTWVVTYDKFPAVMRLPRAPLLEVESIKHIDTDGVQQTLASSRYRVASRSQRITVAYGESWPAIRSVADAIEVTYKAGYGTTRGTEPPQVKDAILLLVDHLFRNRGPVLTGTIATELDWSIRAILDPLKCKVQPGWYGLAN